jgi:hypothetical protein
MTNNRGQSTVKQSLKRLSWLMVLLSAVVLIIVLLLEDILDSEGMESVDIEPEVSQPQPSPLSVTSETNTYVSMVGNAAPQSKQLEIVLRDGQLSVALDNAPLRQVMAELSRLTGIEIRFKNFHQQLMLNQHFENVPLEQGLRFLLRGIDSMFVYAGIDKNRRLTRILLLGDNTGNAEEVVNIFDMTKALAKPRDEQIVQLLDGVDIQIPEQLKQAIPVMSTELHKQLSQVPYTAVQSTNELATHVRERLKEVGLTD